MKHSYLSDSLDLLSDLRLFASVSVPDPEVTRFGDEIRLRGPFLEKTLLYDGASLDRDEISVKPAELKPNRSSMNPVALCHSSSRLQTFDFFHEKSMPKD